MIRNAHFLIINYNIKNKLKEKRMGNEFADEFED